MSAEVVAFGPSMVDICAPLDNVTYEKCHEILDVDPGSWRLIQEAADIDFLLETIGVTTPDSGDVSPYGPALAAGSSTLGMLGAMPPRIRSDSRLATALAVNDRGLDNFAQYFTSEVQKTGLTHDVAHVEGKNPLGLVVYRRGQEQASHEKTLIMHPGVAQEFGSYNELEDRNPSLLLMDTYELKGGELSNMLDRVVTSGQYRVALSLGNHALLEDGLQAKVRKYVDEGYIHILCGNEEEYSVLYPEVCDEFMERGNFGEHPVREQVPYVMLTRGSRGIDAFWDGQLVQVPAFPVCEQDIVNTSGAGDTAMGVFCSSILEAVPAQEALNKAAYFAGKVICTPSSRVVATY